MSQEAIARAVKLKGTQGALADAIGKTQQYISLLLKGAKISAETAVAIEEVTAGKVARHELRPDLFEKPANGRRKRVA